MTSTTFTLKQLRFTFTLGDASAAKFQGNNNTLVLTGLRATAEISYPGPPTFPFANVRILGMLQSDMAALTGLTQGVLSYNNNSMLIEANSGAGWSTVFAGQLVTVVPDYVSAPAVALTIFAQTLGYELLNPATPTSYAVAADIATVIGTIAAKCGRVLVNVGVTGSFAGPVYFANTPAEQLKTACAKAGIAYYNDQPGVIEIGLPAVPRKRPVTVLSPSSGLLGYPTLNSVNLIGGVAVFNPALQYGAPIEIKDSDQKSANGKWVIYDIVHRLASEFPGEAPWFSQFTAQPPAGFVNKTL